MVRSFVKASGRFHIVVSTGTVLVMYAVLTSLLPILEKLTPLNKLFGSLVAYFTTVGTYKTVATLLRWLLGLSGKVKAYVLGAECLEGTWVGYFVGHSGEHRFIVETFEQGLDSIVIRGCSFAADGTAHAIWNADGVTLDVAKGTLTYAYWCDIHGRKSRQQGLGVFHLERSTSSSAPTGLRGYVADLADGVRLDVVEQRISDRILDFADGLKEARKRFGPGGTAITNVTDRASILQRNATSG
jgi:hypothetical protein